MPGRDERVFWGGLVALAMAGAAATWWTAEQWTPHAGSRATQMWRKATHPGPDILPSSKAGAASVSLVQLRKYVKRPGDLNRPALPGGQPRAGGGWGGDLLACALSQRRQIIYRVATPFDQTLAHVGRGRHRSEHAMHI